MTTIRVARRRRYVVVDQEAIGDARLSFRARGLLAYLLSKPDDWSIDSESLAAETVEGRDAIRSALRELENHGYFRREKRQVEKGRWITEAFLFESPTDDGIPVVGKPGVGSPGAKEPNPDTEKTTPTGSAYAPDSDALIEPLKPQNQAHAIAAKHLAPIGERVKRGGTYDLVGMIRDAWNPAWEEAIEAGLDPVAVGTSIAGFFFQYVTETEVQWGRVGSLVKKFGKLALFGLDEGTGHATDPYRYAFRRCQQETTAQTIRKGA